MNVWLVSREYAGIAEAGGVKNVACSLCESLAKNGHNVTLFIPLYGCTDLTNVKMCDWEKLKSLSFSLLGKTETVQFSHGSMNGVHIVFVNHPSFKEKKAVYTYTDQEESLNPDHKKGEGHADVNYLNTIFQKSVIHYSEFIDSNDVPYVIHCQDAATAMIPVYGKFYCSTNENINLKLGKTKFAVTIHNAGPGYHHGFSSLDEAIKYTELPKEILSKGSCNGYIEPFVLAGECSCLTTVSPEYATEIMDGTTDTAGLSDVFRERGITVKGITNGMDFSRYEPNDRNKSFLPFTYDPVKLDLDGKEKCRNEFLLKYASQTSVMPEGLTKFGFLDFNGLSPDDFAYVAYHGRVVHQKGIEVMCRAAEKIMYSGLKVKFIFCGQGASDLEKLMAYLALKFPGSIVYIKGYEKEAARLCVAASDFSLHPSWFEPCGLEDFIAQTFGTIPIAHKTGGLQKIIDGKTGFLYSPNTEENLEKLLISLIEKFEENGRQLMRPMISEAARYIHEKYSWNKVSVEYENLYKSI